MIVPSCKFEISSVSVNYICLEDWLQLAKLRAVHYFAVDVRLSFEGVVFICILQRNRLIL